ncbi:noelin-3-like [Branchiostoma floridae x Branchiostoma japonicum]
MATVYSQIQLLTWVQVHGSRDTYYVHSTSEDTSGRCTCTVLAPSPDVCSDDAKYHYIKDLEAQVANLTTLVHQLANRTSSALDIQTTMTLIHSLTSQLDVLEADRQLLLTEHFSSIRDEIQALAGLLPQLQVDSADALLLQIYHTQLSNLSAVLSDLEEQHGLSTAELQLQVMQLTEQLNNCNASKYENPCEKKPCHINAACFHHGESFSCVCLAGYTGDGFYCQGGSVHILIPCFSEMSQCLHLTTD